MLTILFERLPDVVVLAERDGRITRWNPAAAAFLGDRVSPGMPLAELLDTVSSPSTPGRDRLLRAVSNARRSWSGLIDLLDAGEEPVPFSCQVEVGDDGILLLARDARDLRAREAAERELEARDEFVARLGHELRTPLNAVLGFAQLLEMERPPPEQLESVERILTGGRHMQSLLDEVLDLARVRSGGVDLDVGPVPVLDVVRGVVDLLEPLAIKRAMRSYVEPMEDLVALADRRRLWQVLLNLIGNAVKYGREGGVVRVGVRGLPAGIGGGAGTSLDRVRIEIEDDGPGIDPAALQRLFRPFERLGQERGAVEGSGLGLAMSQALVAAMSGELSATSRLGQGTTFRVELPAIDLLELDEPPATSQPEVVVYVTAEPGAQAMVSAALRSRLQVDVVIVNRAAEALETVRSRQPRLVLLDSELPDSSATELLHRLSGDPLSALIPKIVLSFDPDPGVRLRLRAAGASDVLPLPLEVRPMLETVSRLLRRR
jgi:signal transduction histidine kinase/CheY-like chemotaxis protein